MPAINSRGRGRRTINEINMVPFIDVMLVLLIIFMVTAPLITPSMIALPRVGKAPGQPPKPIQIEISKEEVIQIKSDGQSVPARLSEVGPAVKRLQPAVPAGEQLTPVVISADKSIKYETVVKVMDALQKAGVARVGLSVQTGN
ncbi:biopolymer transporter ExbD [Polaromonas sp. SM01]|uniref:biopolymer transporter ExbD n=1 Tax=Polaromonas sp. SM01 TaxID=3085630 RepID=UPI002980ABD2|nr:biopolymer transporter ExbD [Polaromonas sp. SM01]MDW5443234.1 biopolymer transporter ExbD [Polaromonas sp. SM01]